MPRIVKSVTVPALGVGRPDYSGEQWRAKTFKRISLKGNESLVTFGRCYTTIASLCPWVTTPLAAGVVDALVNVSTGVAMPYAVLAGYELEVLMIWASFNQNVRCYGYMDGQLLYEYYHDAMNIYYESEVVEGSTKDIDPTFALPHTMTFSGENLGIENMRGYAKVECILRIHGTKKPTTKTVRCKWCGNEVEVPIATTLWICSKCGKKTLFKYFPWGGKVILKGRLQE